MGERGLTIALTDQGELQVDGELDMATAGLLETAITEVVGEERRIVLDLSGLEFIDSSGIRVLITAAKRSGQPLLLRHPDHQVRRVLDVALPTALAMNVWQLD